MLARLFGRRSVEAAPASPPLDRARLVWRDDTRFPAPDWHATAHAPTAPADGATHDEAHAFWCGAARTWLDALAASLVVSTREGGEGGEGAYAIAESPHFMILAALPVRARALTLHYAETTRRRVLEVLPGLADDQGWGKTVILVLASPATYYEYVAQYDGGGEPGSGESGDELALSGGMFIDAGYGHFVFIADEDMRGVEPIIAHELTHSLVRHLPLPAWVNEGIAVNTERRLCPPQGRLETVSEIQEMHRAFWNETTIQEFWSGKSWLRADEGNKLSYELARTFVELAARDWDTFVAFANEADMADGGEGAAIAHLGHPLTRFAEALLGPGDWAPRPATWRAGVEAGQFHARRHA